MFIRRIILENIRGFERLEFHLERSSEIYSGWTVITGDNASGKTALLRAVSLALVGPETARVLQPSLDGWIREGCDVATIALQIIAGPKDRFAQGRRYDQPFWSELQLEAGGNSRVVLTQGQKYLRKGKGPSRGPWQESPEGWFSVGYGPFRRLYGHSPEAQRLMSTPGKVSRFATMFREDATLAEGDLWLRELKHKEHEENRDSRLILRKTLAILNSNFLQHQIRVDRVDSDGLWLRQPDNVVLPLEHMSDGYRAAVATVVDLIRQLVEVYGLEGIADQEREQPIIEHSGVALIDEIDAHLHPSWQRIVGEWFTRVFPNFQFIVTAHSPLICQAASEKGLFHLPAPNSGHAPFQLSSDDYKKIIASRPNEIYLSPAFGLTHTRSPRAVRARRQYASLQAKKQAQPLDPEERRQEIQLEFFVREDEEHAADKAS